MSPGVEMNEQHAIPEEVLDALEAVRASGVTNMFVRGRVLFEIEMVCGAVGAATWLEQNPRRYMDALTAMGQRLPIT